MLSADRTAAGEPKRNWARTANRTHAYDQSGCTLN